MNNFQVGLPGLLDLAKEEARPGGVINTGHLLAVLLRVDPGVGGGALAGLDIAVVRAEAGATHTSSRPRGLTRHANRAWRQAMQDTLHGTGGTEALYGALIARHTLAWRIISGR